MPNTKVPIELSSTPGIIDNSTVTAITIDSAGAATFSGNVGLPLGAIIDFSGRGNITHDASTFDIAFNTNSVANAFVVKGTGAATFSGNVGIGVVPSAWGGAVDVVQTSAGSFWGYLTSDLHLSQNQYWNGSSRIYSTTAAASEYRLGLGGHFWYTTPSGTAGTAVTQIERMTLDASGNLLVGVTTGSSRLQVRGSGSASIFSFETEQPATAIYGAAATLAVASGENLTNAMLYLRKDSGTSRSINAAGTVNASGADYAEYERNGGLSIAKGSIVGFTADGVLTLTFSEAVRFAVKSTDPSYVGGDTWGTEAQVGAKPNNPTRIEDESDADFESREAEYETDLATFEEALEAARQLVDRIAYSGKVPVNVQGAIAGDYIIAVAADDGSIDGQAVSNPDFSQYKLSVGRVNRILDDGRAEVAVIIH